MHVLKSDNFMRIKIRFYFLIKILIVRLFFYMDEFFFIKSLQEWKHLRTVS